MRHVLNVGGDIDRRMRMARKEKRRRKNSHRLCGAPDIAYEDISRKHAAHLLTHFAVLKPEWLADICPACLAAVKAS